MSVRTDVRAFAKPDWLIVALLALRAATGIAHGQPAPARPEDVIRNAVASRAPSAPIIDGDATDAAWGEAWPLSPFVVGDRGDRQASALTRVRLLYDDTALYVLGEMGPSPGTTMAFDGPTQDEELIIYLDPYHDHRRFVELTIDCTGWAFERAAGWVAGGPGYRLSDVEGKAQANDRGWTAEMKIPYSALKVTPEEGDVWGVNVVRDCFGGSESLTFFNAPFGPRDRAPRFGDLFFGPPRLRLRSLRVEGDLIGESKLIFWLGDTIDVGEELSVRVDYSTPFAPSQTQMATIRQGADLALDPVEIPFPVPQAGKGTLAFTIAEPGGEPLYHADYPMLCRPEIAAPGAGRFSFTLDRPLASPGDDVTARLTTVLPDARPVDDGTFFFEFSLLDPTGQPVEPARVYPVPDTQLGCVDHTASFRIPEREGAYSCRLTVFEPTGRSLGMGRQTVLVDRTTADISKLPIIERMIANLASDDPFALSAEALLAGAWRAFYDFPWEQAEIADAGQAIEGRVSEMRTVLSRRSEALADPPKLSETYRLAYRSSVDDSTQPYALYVPKTYDSTKPVPILMYLHGWDGGNGPFGYPTSNADSLKTHAEGKGWLVLYPFGRGNQDWRDAGETDVREVLQEINGRYPLDWKKLYLTGESMGGRGVWHLGMRYPNDFAALVPIAGAAVGSVWGVWNEERFAHNLANTPVFVVHGTRDDIVPVRDARIMRDALDRVSPRDFIYRELPMGGHGGLWESRGEWLDWLVGKQVGASPRSVRYSTDSLRFNRSFFIEVEQLAHEGRVGAVDASVRDGNWVNVLTTDVVRFALDLAAHPDINATAPVSVTVDDSTVFSGTLPEDGRIVCEKGDTGVWTLTKEPIPEGRKRPGLSGPMRDVLAQRFYLVYGSRGNDRALINATYRLAQQAATGWREWWWGTPIVKRDADITDEEMAEAHLILFGGPEVNEIAYRIRDDLPQTSGSPSPYAPAVDPVDVAYKYVYPNPLAPGRYVLVIGATDPIALEQIALLGQKEPYPSPIGTLDVDYLIAVRGLRGGYASLVPVAEGWFGNDWQFPLENGHRRIATGRGWLSSTRATRGWLEPDFHDPSWRPAAVQPRSAVDNDAWKPFALRDFNAVRLAFADTTEPIWHLNGMTPTDECYFRYAFNLATVPASAPARILVEDRGKVWVNGELVCNNTPGDGIIEVDLAPRLRQGPNVIGVEASHILGSYGVIMECDL